MNKFLSKLNTIFNKYIINVKIDWSGLFSLLSKMSIFGI